ncbi:MULTISPECIES: ribonuclease HII [Acidiplasma]|uniref:Ribonuclease HII n=1 Tax=Acidiplasma cupricumulans TaxID=312540 RepID=A0A0Q0RFP5_9ARCH|nr:MULTISPECIES: ribonuclease HII [Acidiplasma]KJE49613.1 ribonuclease HII [Acidiplasma sp. MBA-1]KQB33911.1 ribonuclease HII [Acidiplasma cupricumulans]WMT55840.1 MAG: ribonuclease HII [Acidiplasma sp.]
MDCGIDEAGRGPVIGPMVMAILCSDESIKSLGVRDSKQLSPFQRNKLFEDLKNMENNYVIIQPYEIDNYVKKNQLNILELKYAIYLIDSVKCENIYVDAFDVNEIRLEDELKRRTGKNITCRHKADSIYPVVSGASIIAKVIRDSEIEKLHKIYGNFGSGYPSDPRTINFLKNAIENHMDIDGIVRKEWKTYKNLLNKKL